MKVCKYKGRKFKKAGRKLAVFSLVFVLMMTNIIPELTVITSASDYDYIEDNNAANIESGKLVEPLTGEDGDEGQPPREGNLSGENEDESQTLPVQPSGSENELPEGEEVLNENGGSEEGTVPDAENEEPEGETAPVSDNGQPEGETVRMVKVRSLKM